MARERLGFTGKASPLRIASITEKIIFQNHQISSDIIEYHTGLQVATITENKILMITSLPQDPHLHGVGILIMLLKDGVVRHSELLMRKILRI